MPDATRNLTRQFADNLLRLRGQAAVSQEELSFMALLHRTEVGGLERGIRLPRLDTIIKLAGALNVEPGDLLTGMAWTASDPRPGSFQIGGDHRRRAPDE
jgi:transcriptional regulator with XRE-family HTH domain